MKKQNPEITAQAMLQKIREEVAKRHGLPAGTTPGCGGLPEKPATIPDNHANESWPGRQDGSFFRNALWDFGTRYAAPIKKIPLFNKLAEKCYWKLKGVPRPSWDRDSLNGTEVDIVAANLNYEKFRSQLRREGLKGRIKHAIFQCIGFFAWWQAQINKALHDADAEQKGRIASLEEQILRLEIQFTDLRSLLASASGQAAEMEARIADMNSLQSVVSRQAAQLAEMEARIADMDSLQSVVSRQAVQLALLEVRISDASKTEEELRRQAADHDKLVADLGCRLSILDRLNDSLYEELTQQRMHLVKLQGQSSVRGLAGKIPQ